MWGAIGMACEWKRPRTPSVRLLWDGRATEAVLEFLCTTRVGWIGADRLPREEGEGEDSENEEREGWAHPRLCLSLNFPLIVSFQSERSCAISFVPFFCLSFEVLGSPTVTDQAGLGQDKCTYKKPTAASSAAG